MYKYVYKTPKEFSDLVLYSDGENLTNLFFENSKDALKNQEKGDEKNLPIFEDTCKWLDIYFSGKTPNFTPKYKINNLTPFRKEVIDIMNKIEFGKTTTYGEIADIIAHGKGIEKMSAQAVGGAVGWNPICIIIPCHRVVGSNNSLTGYGGGIQNKLHLLELEGVDTSKFSIPTKGTAL